MASGLEDEQEFDFNQILDALVNPLLRMCELSVEKFPKLDQEIYMVNCMHHVQVCHPPFNFHVASFFVSRVLYPCMTLQRASEKALQSVSTGS